MTCKELGGWCDAQIEAATWEEMMTKGMEHMNMAHPEEAAKIMAMSQEEMQGWVEKTKPIFDAKLAAMSSTDMGTDMPMAA